MSQAKYLISTFICILAIVACTGEEAALTPTQQVYDVVMNERLQNARTEVIVLKRTESSYLHDEHDDELRSYIEREVPIPDALLSKLFESANTSTAIDWKPVMINAIFVDKTDISSESDWRSPKFAEDFRAAFPEQEEFFALSNVALSADQTEAALVLSHYCPAMCGSGEFLIYLKKIGMEWKIEGGTPFWVT